MAQNKARSPNREKWEEAERLGQTSYKLSAAGMFISVITIIIIFVIIR